MHQLGQKIQSELIHVLSVVFRRGNHLLYKDMQGVEEEKKDEDEHEDEIRPGLNQLWLSLLSEIQIVRFCSIGNRNVQKIDVDQSCEARFPFSSAVHGYFCRFKQDVVGHFIPRENRSLPESNLYGQQFLVKELWQRVADGKPNVPIAKLNREMVRRFLYDMIALEAGDLGITRHGKQQEIKQIVIGVAEFVWKATADTHAGFNFLYFVFL